MNGVPKTCVEKSLLPPPSRHGAIVLRIRPDRGHVLRVVQFDTPPPPAWDDLKAHDRTGSGNARGPWRRVGGDRAGAAVAAGRGAFGACG